VPVGVIDVGANTVRLQVSRGGDAIYREKAMLRLGDSIERSGAISDEKLAEAAETVAGFARQARRHGVDQIDVLVTSPGRQAANGEELLTRVTAATGLPVRLLSAEEEGRLAFLGAVSEARGASRRLIAVCDVGGG
jgi:exopolyphosphatase / guanosine-5'-triphosphate,3'-diphosphate pyrophosphatase